MLIIRDQQMQSMEAQRPDVETVALCTEYDFLFSTEVEEEEELEFETELDEEEEVEFVAEGGDPDDSGEEEDTAEPPLIADQPPLSDADSAEDECPEDETNEDYDLEFEQVIEENPREEVTEESEEYTTA